MLSIEDAAQRLNDLIDYGAFDVFLYLTNPFLSKIFSL